MGWYVRKSLNLGPLRINLSKLGLGMSAGVKGLRMGTGPRGKYLHAGGEGLYYRTSLDTHTEQATSTTVQEAANAALDPPLNDLAEGERLAAARWARICARAERLRDADRGFFSRLARGIFGGLARGR